MRVEYINPFIVSVRNAFKTMLSSDAERGAPFLRTTTASDFCVSGVIGLSGDAVGTVVLNMSKEVALGVASVLLMEQFTDLTPDVIDAVGELTNVIAGAAKSKLEEFHLGVSLPNVVTGGAHTIHFPKDVSTICVPFKTAWGPLVLEVGLTPVRQAVGV
jgi:chemotaxis protein CheX